jgi:5'(3')-deoxyribonucleotidase
MDRIVYIDYDSTLVDFLDAWLEEIYETKGIRIRHDQIKSFHDPILEVHADIFMESDLYAKRIRPFLGAESLIAELQKEYKVQILTHTHPKARLAKEKHIAKYFPNIPVIHTQEPKWKFSQNGVLIDDGLHNIEGQLDNTEQLAILFNPGNRYYHSQTDREHERLHLATSYEDIKDLLLGDFYVRY